MAKAKTKSRVKFDIGAVYTRKTKDGQNRWYLDYWDELGKRVQKLAANAQTVEDAEVALRTEVTKAFAKAQGIEEQKRIVFNDFAPTYLENYAKPNKRSWKCDDYCLEAHLKPYFGKFDMRDITPLEIEAYRAKRLKAGVKQSTTNREMALLKKMFHLAEDWGYCEKNPVMKVRLFSEKNNRRDRFLTDDEERRLLGHCRPHLVPIVIVALNTGMRLREVLRLRWDQIDADVKSVRVTRTKNGLDRTIPLNEAAYQAINAQREKSQGNYVFPSPKGKECMTSVSHSFARARRLAGIPDFHFHDTRHTFGTRLIRKGKDIITVQELMGHGSVTITQRYTHTGADRKREAVESLDQKPKNALRGCDTEVTEKSCVQATDSSTVN